MREEKILKKTIIILLAAVLAVGLFAVWSNANYWIRPASEIENIHVRLTLKSGYKDMMITDRAEIEYIRNMVTDVQDELNIFDVVIRDAEHFQADVPICLQFNYSDGRRQEFYVLRNAAVCFVGQDYYWKYIGADNVNTDDLYDYFKDDFK